MSTRNPPLATAEAALAGRLALVTGAARGNGAAIACGLAHVGATVIMTNIDADAVSAAVAVMNRPNLHAHRLDVTDVAACDALATRIQQSLGPVALLVNNAGVLMRDHDADVPRSADRVRGHVAAPYGRGAAAQRWGLAPARVIYLWCWVRMAIASKSSSNTFTKVNATA